MSTSTSIPEAKSHFLRSQVRLLSSPLRTPSTDTWPSLSPSTIDTAASELAPPALLQPKLLEEITDKVNSKIKSHNRMVFSSQSQRHVVEQIDALYWSDVTSVIRDEEGNLKTGETGQNIVWIDRDLDLSEHRHAGALPETLREAGLAALGSETHAQGEGHGRQEERYTQLREKLVQLAHRKEVLAKKVAAYKNLRRLLEPFEDAVGSVQPNLVVRDGELERELERMRVLIARVGGKMKDGGNLQTIQDGNKGEEELNEQERLRKVFELG